MSFTGFLSSQTSVGYMSDISVTLKKAKARGTSKTCCTWDPGKQVHRIGREAALRMLRSSMDDQRA